MSRLLLFRIACVFLFLMCMIALGIEIFVHDVGSLTVIYIWAGLAFLSLCGNIAGALLSLKR